MQEAGADQYESEHKTFNHTRYENAQNRTATLGVKVNIEHYATQFMKMDIEHNATINENGHKATLGIK